MIHSWLFIFSLLIGPGPKDLLTQDLAASRGVRISQLSYNLEFKFQAGSSAYEGHAILSFADTTPEKPLDIDFQAGEILQVTVGEVPTADFLYSHEEGRLRLPASHLKSQDNLIAVRYRNNFSTDGSGFHRFVDVEDKTEYHYTDFQPYRAHHVFPCFDQPDLRGKFKVTLHTPKTWTAMANGALLSSKYVADRRELVFQETPPISAYLFHLSVGDFAEHSFHQGLVPMRLLCRQSQEEYMDPDGIFAVTDKGIRFFAEYFAMPFPFDKYDQAFVPEYNAGAMENVGAVVLNESLNMGYYVPESLRALRDSVILHEVAHHWFGNLVSLQWWDGLWLNESFASYMELVGMEALGYSDPWHQTLDQRATVYLSDSLSTTHPVVLPIADTKQAEANFDDITYTKGMATLRQLDFSLGGTAFRDALRDYFQKHAWKSTSVTDFLDAMKLRSPQDLSPWIQTWLYQSGVNGSQIHWEVENGRISKAEMLQTPGSGAGVLRSHATQLGLFKADPEKGAVLYQTLKIHYEGISTPLPQLVGLTEPAFILPNWQEYDYTLSQLDPRSLSWLLANAPEIQNPTLRQQIWHLLFLELRAGNLGVLNFLELARLDMALQAEGEGLRLTADFALRAIEDYLPEQEAFQAVRSRIFEDSKKSLEKERGDFQMRYLFFILMRDTAHSQEELDFLYAWLEGKENLKGWVLDEEDKLSIIEALMVRQYQKAPTLFKDIQKEELIADSPLLQLLASVPDATAKARAWDLILDPTFSLENKRKLMGDFFAKGQDPFTDAYLEQYFDLLPKVYQRDSWPFARDLVQIMFPRHGDKKAIKAAKRMLKKKELPQVLKTLVTTELELLENRRQIRAINQKMPLPTIGQ